MLARVISSGLDNTVIGRIQQISSYAIGSDQSSYVEQLKEEGFLQGCLLVRSDETSVC